MLKNPTESLSINKHNMNSNYRKASNKERRSIDDASQLLSILRDFPLIKSFKRSDSFNKSLEQSPTTKESFNYFTIHENMHSYFNTPPFYIYPNFTSFDYSIPIPNLYNNISQFNKDKFIMCHNISNEKPIIHPNQITDEIIKNSQETKTKRNKSFYKEIRNYFKQEPELNGFLNEIFFLINPKMHVGPKNRDGTFEKRVRLHFIECKDVKVGNIHLKLCWGTLLDKTGIPVFRKSNDVYKIPGNQSSRFRNGNSLEGWILSNEEQKQQLREEASIIVKELESKWINENRTIVDAIEIVKSLDIPSNKKSFSIDYDNLCPSRLADIFWKDCNFTNENIVLNEFNRSLIKKKLNIDDESIDIIDLFRLFKIIGDDCILKYDAFKLAIFRFGPPNVMYQYMKSLLRTKSFNVDLDSERTKELLQSHRNGSFVIRYSKSSPEKFCLAFRTSDNKISQYRDIMFIYTKGIDIDGEIYKDWEDVVNRNRKFLKHPIIHNDFKNIMMGLFYKLCIK